MANINVTVVSAESQVFSGEASFVVVPGESGELGILPGHAPFISKIKPGLVLITHSGDDKRQEELFVAGGLLEVQPDHVSILADTVLRCDELDFERASAAKQKAEEQLIVATDAKEIALVEAELAMLTAQLMTLRKVRRK